MAKTKKIAVIYFDEMHIIPHFVGPVATLYNDPAYEVDILTYKGTHNFLYEILKEHNIPPSIVKQLPTFKYREIIEKLKQRKIPSPLYLFKKHKNLLLNNYDALIFNDINHEYLYRYKKNDSTKFVLLMHGAGDGEYLIGKSYKESIEKFDLVTTPGTKITRFFSEMNLSDKVKIEPCGYQKFDIININKKKSFFDNDKPVILYNPHFKPELSSWYQYGQDILEFFYQNKNYNLIFAPHINLFNKKGFLSPDIIKSKYFKADNIHIDFNSYHLVNMDYTLSSDLYLGDVSSQIYEFILRPRPAIFINAHNINWIGNPHYKHWEMGEVVKNIDTLKNILTTREKWHQKYLNKQKELFDDTFIKLNKGEASLKIKNAIENNILNL